VRDIEPDKLKEEILLKIGINKYLYYQISNSIKDAV
jgi:hypothetical protein